jgi:undecaprenyl-diphosphatase
VYATGFAISALVGWLALLALLAIVRRGALHYFAPYCWLAGGAALYFFSGGPTG